MEIINHPSFKAGKLFERNVFMSSLISAIYNSILEGQKNDAVKNVKAALDSGINPETILNEGMVAAMGEVGRLFEEGEYFVPEMLVSARAMQEGLSILKPALAQNNVQSAGKIIIGTVQGDLHDIGKNLVSMMLEGAAFEVHDLGTDVSPEKFVQAVQSTGAQIVAMSALLTTTMGNMKNVIQALEAAGLRQQVKVMVGGAPLTDQFARQIGADGYSADASKAVVLARNLLN
jgi:5-methyltetrahydrofolate--homocysteine methyltransferase